MAAIDCGRVTFRLLVFKLLRFFVTNNLLNIVANETQPKFFPLLCMFVVGGSLERKCDPPMSWRSWEMIYNIQLHATQ